MRTPRKRWVVPPVWLWVGFVLILAASVGIGNLDLLVPNLTPLERETTTVWAVLTWLVAFFLGSALSYWGAFLLLRWLTERLGGNAAGSGRRDRAAGG